MTKGYGFHTGKDCTVRFFADKGPVRFLCKGQIIPAHITKVVNTKRCTVLGDNGETLALVEHLLAALAVKGWWRNLLIEVDGNELPILDGSAQGWLEPIAALGQAPEIPESLSISEPISVVQGLSFIEAIPSLKNSTEDSMNLATPISSLRVDIDFEHPAIGKQHWSGGVVDYPDLLSARTFGFLNELEALQSAGLASRAGLENAIVFGESAALAPLRFNDEPVRHKALDALGDLFLLARPLDASISIMRGSHQLHVALVKKLYETFHLNKSFGERFESPSA